MNQVYLICLSKWASVLFLLQLCQESACRQDNVTANTGHVAIINSVVRLDNTTVSALIFDASSSNHFGSGRGCCGNDKNSNQLNKRNGVGMGAIHLRIDDKGQIKAFKFDQNTAWHPQNGSDETIFFAIGRLEQLN